MSYTCPYCATEVNAGNDYFCSFCQLEVRPAKDGSRKPQHYQIYFDEYEVEKPTAELMKLHTFQLLYLLRLVRKERGNSYGSLNTFHKAVNAGAGEFKDNEQQQGKTYEYWTRKAWIIENILLDRMGYIPERINDRFLEAYLQRCEKRLKPMRISKERKQKA
jgi:hypothetical protein